MGCSFAERECQPTKFIRGGILAESPAEVNVGSVSGTTLFTPVLWIISDVGRCYET
jgi:hypothetical protein